MRNGNVPAPASVLFCLAALAAGCGGPSRDQDGPATGPPLSQGDQILHQQLQSALSDIINEQTIRYVPLQYSYNEGLLEILDQVEPFLSGDAEGEPPRFMPELDAEEELDHLRETVRRWEAKTGNDLRAEIDYFKAEVAARDPGEVSHPEFHANFSKTFDDLIAIEVAELRERCNRAIHDEAEPLLAPHRDTSPEVVRRLETVLNSPQYKLPDSGSPEASRPEPDAP